MASLGVSAQDTITIMQYNLCYYGNFNSSYANCNESTNSTELKNECIRKIVGHIQPDIITVNEMGATQALINSFMDKNLNINGITYWKTSNMINYASSNIINSIYYNSQKLALKKHDVIRTSVRDIDVYELYFRTASLHIHDTISLVCVVAHLKAGNSDDDIAKRRVMTQLTMDYLQEHYPADNVLFMGDFNFYSSNESAYKLMTSTYSNPDILFIDPAGPTGVGQWNNNPYYSPYFTQSTNRNSGGCKSGGGLDDRFDFIMMSDEIGFGFKNVRYVANSYHAFGNDGNSFDQSINNPNNTSLPADILNSLYNCSDHLPICMKLSVNANLSLTEASPDKLHLTLRPNPTQGQCSLGFYNETPGMVMIEVFNNVGQLIDSQQVYYCEGSHYHSMQTERYQKGFYMVRVSNARGLAETTKLVVQ